MRAWSVASEKLREKAYGKDVPPAMKKDLLRQAKVQALNDVYGVGHRVDRHGNPIEQGIGAPGNGSLNDAESYRKYHTAPLGTGFDQEVYDAKLKNAHETRAARAKQRQDDDEEE